MKNAMFRKLKLIDLYIAPVKALGICLLGTLLIIVSLVTSIFLVDCFLWVFQSKVRIPHTSAVSKTTVFYKHKTDSVHTLSLIIYSNLNGDAELKFDSGRTIRLSPSSRNTICVDHFYDHVEFEYVPLGATRGDLIVYYRFHSIW